MKLALVIVAAGSGTRMKLGINKIFNTLHYNADEWIDESKSTHFLERDVENKVQKSQYRNSTTILECTLLRFANFQRKANHKICELVITYRKQDYEQMRALVEDFKSKISDLNMNIKLVEGGSERYLSVFNALKSLSGDITHVLVHDGVRPFISQDLYERLINGFVVSNVVIPVMKLTDTIREMEENHLGKTLNRDKLCSIQTPQCYSMEIAEGICDYIDTMLQTEDFDNLKGITDDSSLIARVFPKEKQMSVEGSKYNIKITTPEDMDFADMIYHYLGEKDENWFGL